MSDTATQTRTRTTEAKHYGVFERHPMIRIPQGVTTDQIHAACEALGVVAMVDGLVEAWLSVNPDVEGTGSRECTSVRLGAIGRAVADRSLQDQAGHFATVPADMWHEHAPRTNLWDA